MELFLNLHWASTEVIYIGGYSIVILVSLLTVMIAKRAAAMQDLEQAQTDLRSETQAGECPPLPFPRPPSIPAHANDAGTPDGLKRFPLPRNNAA